MQTCHKHYHSTFSLLLTSLFLITVLTLILSFVPPSYFVANAAYVKAKPAAGGPILNDPNLKMEKVFEGLNIPTSMAFLGTNDILVLEKNKGTVDRIMNGKMSPEPLLEINNIANEEVEWGLLGIAVNNNSTGSHPPFVFFYGSHPPLVFLYYTENQTTDRLTRNHVYRYELSTDGSKLVNPKLLLDLPALSADPKGESNHNGGKVVIGPDHNIYAVIGDVGGHRGQAQNKKHGQALDGTSGVLRITQDGHPVLPDPLGDDDPTKVYYAFGIRNSFGIDIDPVTGNMWNTENGAYDNDEINMVQPGFNSGWRKVQGMAPGNFDPAEELLTFDGKGKYHNPQFVWNQTVGPTALKFLNSDKLGKQYENTIFVGDVNIGNLYNFKLDEARTVLSLPSGPLADKVAYTRDELKPVIFGQGFGVITDIEVGNGDGYLYILTYDGSIYRIFPR